MRIPDPAIHTNHILLTVNENPRQTPWYLRVFKGKKNKYCLQNRNKKRNKSGRSLMIFNE